VVDARSPLLAVSGLAKSFGGVHAVKDCTLSVEERKVVGLIGPNGAGKSTALGLISGFLQPDAGTVAFDGREIQGWPGYRVSRAGLMRTFQSPREWAGMTVMENMLVAAPQHGRSVIWRALLTRRSLAHAEAQDRIQARQLLEEFGLMGLRDELAGNLSGGQKRLLEFARIMFAHPRMVLLDEPLAGVNPVLAQRIGDAISQLQTSGITVLLVEHNLPFVEQACDAIVVMAEGTTLARGSLAQLRADRAVVDAYLGEVPAGA
jgi:ABC-type branched-subunit amino acid transport system ATPase component